MASTTLKLEIITPEKIALREEAVSVIVPAVDGSLGLWPNHAPLLGGLEPGVVRYKVGNDYKKCAVSGGFLEVANNVVTIIAPSAELSGDIDVARAEEAKKRAEERLKNRKEAGIDVLKAELALRKAIARINATK